MLAKFSRRRDSLEVGPTSGHSATDTNEDNIDHGHHLVMDDRQLSIDQITNAIRES